METLSNYFFNAYHESSVQFYHDKAVEYIHSHTSIPRLASHFDVFLFSFAYFTILSHFIYYLLAPKLIKYERPSASSKVTYDSLSTGSLRVKWAHMILSFLHALAVTGVAAILYFYDVGFLASTVKTRLFGFTNPHGTLLAFSSGYFAWDVFVCIYHHQTYGPSFLVHAIMSIIGIVNAFNLNHPLAYYASRFLLFEASTIFLDIHWFLSKLGMDKSKLQFASDLMGLLSYVLVRIGFGYFTTYELSKDLWSWYQTGGARMEVIILTTLLQLATHSLNLYWFAKLVRSALGGEKPAKKVKKN